MKIAIDHQQSRSGDQTRGIGFHTKNLLESLKKYKDLDIQLIDSKLEDVNNFDIIHYPLLDTHLSVLPGKFKTRTVITIHDTIKLIYPKAYPLGLKGKLRFLRLKKSVKNADAIITISNTSKKDIIRFFGVNPDKIFVTYLAPQKLSTKKSKSIKLPEKFVLYIGGVNYNKNLLVLAEACKLAHLPLVMVGGETTRQVDSENIELKPWVEFLTQYKDDKDIVRLGYLDDETLNYVWSKASIYCQPSLYEGFGLPVLEAFEHKVPVVASKTQALVEIGGKACIYCDPHSPQEFANAFIQILANNKIAKEYVKNGLLRLNNFSWDKTAKDTYEVYKTVFNK